MWHEIKTKDDIQSFMDVFGHFHDSCIKEINYVSGAFVDEDLSMSPVNDKRELEVIFQRQVYNPTTIEMCFCGLVKLNLEPVGINYTCEIHGAILVQKDGCFYWFDSDIPDMENYNGTWICAKGLRWRIID